MNGYSKVSSKGQITLSAEIRKRLNIEPGTYLSVVADGEGVYLTPVKESISQLRGAVAVDSPQDFRRIRQKTMGKLPVKLPRVIDANILLRFLTNDDPDQAAACEALLLRVETGLEKVFLPDLVIADVVWTLEKFYRVEKKRIKELLIPLLAAEGLTCSNKGQILSALAIYSSKNIDWTDAFIAAHIIENGQPEVYSYDQDFDRLPEITRIEPS
jgi:uncharacterized protein